MRRDEFAVEQLNQPNAGSSMATVTNFPDPQAVVGPLTNDELRVSPVDVAGPLTDAELRASDVPVIGPLTDIQLRASSVQIIGERELAGPLDFEPQDVTPAERITKAVPGIDSNHAQIHAGTAYSVFVRIAALANGATKDFALTVPAGAYVHFQLAELSGDGGAELDVYKGATLTKGTVVMTPQNRNQIRAASLSLASVLTFKNVSAVSDAGTLQDGATLYGGSQRGAVGKAGDENEWVLVPGEHLFRVTGRLVAGFNGHLRLFWYEEGAA